MTSRSFFSFGCAALTMAACVLVPWSAAYAVTLTVTNTPLHVQTDSCGNGTFQNCREDAYVIDTLVAYGDQRFENTFRKAFDAWNMGNAADAKWSLVDAGNLEDEGDLLVAVSTKLFEKVGGIDISIEGRRGLNLVNANWAQGLHVNYTVGPNGGLVDPFFEMDVLPADPNMPDRLAPPLYPAQTPEGTFVDMPLAPWASGFFDGIAMISAADFTTRELMVFEGVAYGFKLSASAVG